MKKKNWPRHWFNYPIILSGIFVQLVAAIALAFDSEVMTTTVIHALNAYMPRDHGITRWAVVSLLLAVSSLAFAGFYFKRNIYTIFSLLPQQFVMFLCAGGAMKSMVSGVFADGTVRTSAFLMADQVPLLSIAIFHTWAVVLLARHGADELN